MSPLFWLSNKLALWPSRRPSALWVIFSPSSAYWGWKWSLESRAPSRQGAETARQLGHLSICDHPSVTWGKQTHFGIPCACLKQNDYLVRFGIKTSCPPPPSWCPGTPEKELVRLSPSGLWFGGLPLPEGYLIESAFCPIPFPFSFLEHSGWRLPQKDKSPWTTAPFQHGACCAALQRASFSQPNEPERGLLLGSHLSSPQSW